METFEGNFSEILRAAEKDVDGYYRKNLLVTKPFALACWNILAIFEDIGIFEILKGNPKSVYEIAAHADYIVTNLQFPLFWLWNSCTKGGQITNVYNEQLYKSARELALLAENYHAFVSAYTYARKGIIELEVQDHFIFPKQGFFRDSRYEAYDRLIKSRHSVPRVDYSPAFALIEKGLSISESNFVYNLSSRLVKQVKRILLPIIRGLFELPENWKFSNYSISQFREMAGVLFTIAFIHHTARIIAALNGCKGAAIDNCILILTKPKLIKVLSKYSGLALGVAEHFVDDFTFGSRGIKKPDPALQPLIKLNRSNYAISPSLVIANSLERNYIVLMNRIPSERSIYLRLTQEKEAELRNRIITEINVAEIRNWKGKLTSEPVVPDIDFALISDEGKTVLFIELKWFISPSDSREVIEKTYEIRKGISQLKAISKFLNKSDLKVFSEIGITPEYKRSYAVLSANSIGDDWGQDEDFPVLQVDHFIRKLNSLGDLNKVIKWVRDRGYLPVQDQDYTVVHRDFNVSNWKIRWYGIKINLKEEFDP